MAFELANGYRTERVYGDSNRAYATYVKTEVPVKDGLHWGCDDCALTRS